MLIFNGWIPKLKDRIFGHSIRFLQYLSVGIFNTVIAIWILGVWGKRFSVPWINGGDGELNFILVRNIQRTGWTLENPNLGLPGKSHIFDLPQGGENLQFLAMKIISYFTSAAGAVNIYFLLTFPIVAMATFGAVKWWGLKPATAFVVSSLYTFLPYHFFKGEGHLLLSMYGFIPFIVVYCFKSVLYKVELTKWQWVLFVIFAASINSYYTVFGLVIIVFALLFNFIRKSKISLRQQLMLVGSIISVFIINQMPSIIYTLQNDRNSVVSERGYDGAEVYGLQITDMFLPRIGHRIPIFSEAGTAVSKAGLGSELGQSLGLVASIGIVSLILYGIYKLVRQEPLVDKFHFPFLATVGLILFTVSSSITLLLGMARFTEIRSWNRVVVIIGFIGLLYFGYILEKIMENKKLSQVSMTLILIFVLVVGILDQTSVDDRINIDSVSKRANSECELLTQLEDSNVHDARIFQLPFVQFPEVGTVVELSPYRQGLATLCDTDFKFSFGATRGRDDDFQRRLGSSFSCASKKACTKNEDKIAKSLNELKKARFWALMIYRDGYIDQGKSIEIVLTQKLGEPIESIDGSQLAFQL